VDWAAYQADLLTIWPEIILSITVLLALISDLVLRGKDTRVTGWITILGTLFALYFVCKSYPMDGASTRSFGLLLHDPFAMFFKLLLGSGLLVVLFLSVCFRGFDRDGIGEYYSIITAAVLGGFFLVSTDHLVMVFLALETLSISSYVLAGFLKKDIRGSEAAIKYLVYGVFSSGAMLYGFSLLYGYSGSVHLSEMGAAVFGYLAPAEGGLGSEGLGVLVAFVLVLTGFGYKVAAFPFHFWSPDVYEGAPTPVTTFLAVVSKVASFGMILRFCSNVFTQQGEISPVLGQVVAILAAASMFYGNISAMLQTNAKRLLAYSSIAHSGYLLMGVAAMLSPASEGLTGSYGATLGGGQAVAFYLAAYLPMNLGAFAVVLYFSNRYGVESVDRYAGLGWKAPIAGIMMVIFLTSLTGIPPTVGFVGKWYLFLPVLEKGMTWLAVVAGINSVISLFYYFRFVRAMFFETPQEELSPRRGAFSLSLVTLVSILGLVTVYFGLRFGTLSELVQAF
jgi:NADH-quinone oxidoreductase subunit N